MSSDSIQTDGSVRLPPDPRFVATLGRNHSLEGAIAELIDNSIDADARNVLIRFVSEDGLLRRVLVVDDGSGMTEDGIDVAMTLGGPRSYGDQEIGRFGVGLKAASFSQAQSATVLSRARGAHPVGRRWHVEVARQDFECDVVPSDFARTMIDRDWGFGLSNSGTIVIWDEIRGFPAAAQDTDRFLQRAFARIRDHLGLVFHRWLERGQLKIRVDVAERELVGISSNVEPVDPFGYVRTGSPGWPKALRTPANRGGLLLDCHIWPGRSTAAGFRLDGNLLARQGFWIYYNDRIVQLGGWNDLVHPDKQLGLARIAIDIAGDVDEIFRLTPEKDGVEVGPGFLPAIRAARDDDGANIEAYLDDARNVFKASNQRNRGRSPMLPLGAGFHPKVRRAFETTVPVVPHGAPVDIRWDSLPDGQFFEVDRERQVLWLNKEYRYAVLGGRRGGLNDAPLVKTLLFLLTENVFTGQHLGPRDKDNIEMWQVLLSAAARVE